ncbi:MAG: 16S rRNA (cytosine(1402)-N(4))-methyltransferase RsmH [Patescibacteria group bacterium]
MAGTYHTPVLLNEVLNFFRPGLEKKYIDATFGFGGHSNAIAEKGGTVLGIEADGAEMGVVGKTTAVNPSVTLAEGNFRDIGRIAKENGFLSVAGILFDLGLSSWQLEMSERGFSFQRNEPLDMRLNGKSGVTAADLVNGLYENELAELFNKFGQEPRARRFARVIAQRRQIEPFRSAVDLAGVVEKASGTGRGRIHPATRVFQALRIAVNQELENISTALPQALELLGSGGRLAVISFHSLEDRIVKLAFKEWSGRFGDGVRILTPKPIVPGSAEISRNPRSRSAKLRVMERII